MAEDKLQVEIMIPERPLAAETADEVSFPASDGYMGVLPSHTPLVAELGTGEVTYRQGSSEKKFAVSGGFVQVNPDRVTILANEASPQGEIDREKAEADLKKAEEDLARADVPAEVDEALTAEKSARTRLELLGN